MIGIVSGILVVFAVWFVENVLKVDDPVGAVAVHGFNGAWGTLAVGLFATDGGLFYGGGAHLLGVQSLGVVSIAAYAAVAMSIIFLIMDKVWGCLLYTSRCV